jgi:hypothetical protein
MYGSSRSCAYSSWLQCEVTAIEERHPLTLVGRGDCGGEGSADVPDVEKLGAATTIARSFASEIRLSGHSAKRPARMADEAAESGRMLLSTVGSSR